MAAATDRVRSMEGHSLLLGTVYAVAAAGKLWCSRFSYPASVATIPIAQAVGPCAVNHLAARYLSSRHKSRV